MGFLDKIKSMQSKFSAEKGKQEEPQLLFVEKIKALDAQFSAEKIKQQENCTLYGVFEKTPPLAKHIVFAAMSEELIQHLIDSYNRTVPAELLTLYRSMNGCNLFWESYLSEKYNIALPMNRFSVYGIPLTFRERVEPFNISIEDLNRPQGTPQSWLKFGCFYKPNVDFSTRFDLFADTDISAVYAVEHGIETCVVSEQWDSIDTCLCAVFDLLST